LSWFWERRTIQENDWVILYEEGGWYIIEYKPFKDMPVVHRGETKTFVNMIIETALLPNGEPIAVRAKYPKDEFSDESFKIILSTFHNWTRWIEKKIREVEAYKGVLEGGRT